MTVRTTSSGYPLARLGRDLQGYSHSGVQEGLKMLDDLLANDTGPSGHAEGDLVILYSDTNQGS